MIIEVHETDPDYAVAMAEKMRVADRAEATCLGDPIKLISRSVRLALFSRTAFVDGELAAMWGVGGVPGGHRGRPWLVTTAVCERPSPIAFARIYVSEVARMQALFPLLENFVDASYAKAIRMLGLAGFSLDEPRPLIEGKPPFRRFWWADENH